MNAERTELSHNAESVPIHTNPKRRYRGETRLSLNLTAMIDVVFLLLIYFVVATDFKLGEEVYRLDLPPRGSAETIQDPFELDEEPLRIHVQSTGLTHRAYSLRLDGPYDQPGSFDDLTEFLQQRQINEQSTGGLFPPDHPIVVQPSSATPWEHAVAAFNAIARAQYTNITFLPADQ